MDNSVEGHFRLIDVVLAAWLVLIHAVGMDMEYRHVAGEVHTRAGIYLEEAIVVDLVLEVDIVAAEDTEIEEDNFGLHHNSVVDLVSLEQAERYHRFLIGNTLAWVQIQKPSL